MPVSTRHSSKAEDASPKEVDKKTQEGDVVYNKVLNKHEYEFGGPVGVFALMIWSHYILFYFW